MNKPLSLDSRIWAELRREENIRWLRDMGLVWFGAEVVSIAR